MRIAAKVLGGSLLVAAAMSAPSPEILSLTEDGLLTWTFPGHEVREYRVEWTPDLDRGEWADLGYGFEPADEPMSAAVPVPDSGMRFFRVRAVPPEPVVGHLEGMEAIEGPLPYEIDPAAPVSLLLSRRVFPAEDGHVDAILWLGNGAAGSPGGWLAVTLIGQDGEIIWREETEGIPGARIFVSPRFPPERAGQEAKLKVEWFEGGSLRGSAEATFSVAPANPGPASGRIAIEVHNEDGVTAHGVPLTVGVPFPRGALWNAAHVRLVDEAGREVPLQVKETARWSRFGSIKWLLCDFSPDLSDFGRGFHLEYGPNVRRQASPGLLVRQAEGFPWVETALLRVDAEGLWFRGGDRIWRRTLDEAALWGGYVVREDGREYRMDPSDSFEIEEQGPEKVVVLRRGWFREPESGDTFCQYVTRFVLNRDSPLLRIFHTWIFTGDAYADRIRDIGWRFPAAAGLAPLGFRTASGHGGEWRQGDYLRQHDFDAFEVVAGGQVTHTGQRAPGVMGMSGAGVRVLAGVQDFWQNYPHELGFADGGMTWHLWPRHGKAARHDYATLDLHEFQRLWFAHEGEVLDFAMPEEYFTRPEILEAMHGHTLGDGRYRDTANAQGVAKTTEIWLHLGGAGDGAEDAVGLLEGLQRRSVRAVVDPDWVCASGAFHEVHPYDPENYPVEEHVYALHASAPATWAERLRYYGKWIWGDMNWEPHLRERFGVVYRGFRKAHQGWPYSWLPYARSGTPEYLAFADAATRYLADVVFCHYADERAVIYVGGEPWPRPRGFNIRFSIPWANHRYSVGPTNNDYTDKCNYLWHAWYLTGYARARDVALDWGWLTRHEPSGRYDIFGQGADDWARNSVTILQSYVEMYEAVHEPWFLAAAHQVARQQMIAYRDKGWTGHFWNPGPREFHRFTGCDDYEEFYLAYARAWLDQHRMIGWTQSAPQLESAPYAYLLTGDEYFLGRAAGWLDRIRAFTYEGEPGYFRGYAVSGSTRGNGPLFTGYFLQQFPLALHAFEAAGRVPAPVFTGYWQLGSEITPLAGGGYHYRVPEIHIRKLAGQAIPLRMAIQQADPADPPEIFTYRVRGPECVSVSDDFEGYAVGDQWHREDLSEDTPNPPPESGWSRYRLFGLGPHDALEIRQDPADADNRVLFVNMRREFIDGAYRQPWVHWDAPGPPATGRFSVSFDFRLTEAHGARFAIWLRGGFATEPRLYIQGDGRLDVNLSTQTQETIGYAAVNQWYRAVFDLEILPYAGDPDNGSFDLRIYEIGSGGAPGGRRHAGTKAPIGFTSPGDGFSQVRLDGRSDGAQELYLDRFVVDRWVVGGHWDLSATEHSEIPASAPGGAYRVEIEGVSRFSPEGSYRAFPALAVPLTPPGTPEVMALGEGRALGPTGSQTRSQYWFRMPEATDAAWIDFTISPHVRRPEKPGRTTRWCDLVRIGVWNGDGQAAWLREFSGYDYDGPETIRAEFAVPAGQQGRLWQITIPNLNPGFRLGPNLPPYLAVDPERWFEP